MKALALRLVVVSGRRVVSRQAPAPVRRAQKVRSRVSGIRARRGVPRRIGRRAGKGLRAIAVRVGTMVSGRRAGSRVVRIVVNAPRVLLVTVRRAVMRVIAVRAVTPVIVVNAPRVLLATVRRAAMRVTAGPAVSPVIALNALRVLSATVPHAQATVPSVVNARRAVSTNRCRRRHAVSAMTVRHAPTSRAAPRTLHEPNAPSPTATRMPRRAHRVAITKTHPACCVCRS
jgi:hypothetical protein